MENDKGQKLLNKTWLVPQLVSHLRTPLFRNGYLLTVSSVATSGLGIVYWLFAARMYSAELVGKNSAAIAALLFLSGVSGLFLDGALIRFIPRAGKATGRLIGYAYLVSGLAAILVGILFLAGIQIWAPALAFLKEDIWLFLAFVLGTLTICIFSEQDGALLGLRQAAWIPVENTIYAVAKIVLLIIFSRIIPQYGIFASWTLPAGVLIVLVSLLIFRRLYSHHLQETKAYSEPIRLSQIVRYTAGNYFSFLFSLAYIMLPPVMVFQLAGAKASAYFYLPWIITNSLRLFATNMSNSLIVEGSIDQRKTMEYFKKSVRNTILVLLLLVVGLLVAGPLILQVFGKDYSAEGIKLLRLLLLGTLPAAFVSLANGLMRVENRVGPAILIQALTAFFVLSLSLLLLPIYGIAGVGWAWLASHTLVAICITLLFLRNAIIKDKVIPIHEESDQPSA